MSKNDDPSPDIIKLMKMEELERKVGETQVFYETILKFVEETTRRFGEITYREERDSSINTKKHLKFHGFDFYLESGIYSLGNGGEILVKRGDDIVVSLHYNGGPKDLKVTSSYWDTQEERDELFGLARKKGELWKQYELVTQAEREYTKEMKTNEEAFSRRKSKLEAEARRLSIHY